MPQRLLLHCLQADLWSIGTILFELLVGKPPFNGANHMQLLRNIERNEAKLPDHVAARLSGPCKSLLGRLLQRNPVERISFEEFFTHPFLSGTTGRQHLGPSKCSVQALGLSRGHGAQKGIVSLPHYLRSDCVIVC